ncbi:YhbY family RNA-binding protein [Erysipelothrix urinaevulpis]|uniref:YhbY family RNA-binding protein n=1 Tax=Erysipelothrix urinaevulpis TaxID=2683717 RepID=UPI00135C9548|nr:YhbY family RNA-binding protein [Erysipelothrix urinaevulpis]
MLSNKDKKELRRLAHHEKNLVNVGKHGLTDNLYESFEAALEQHNLVKVNILKTSSVTLDELIESFVHEYECELVNKTGRVAIFYKYHEEGRIKL